MRARSRTTPLWRESECGAKVLTPSTQREGGWPAGKVHTKFFPDQARGGQWSHLFPLGDKVFPVCAKVTGTIYLKEHYAFAMRAKKLPCKRVTVQPSIEVSCHRPNSEAGTPNSKLLLVS